ncbi:MAG: HAMP domain-containing sensor histidine kinase, partial [Dermatophilaceae bacterium]
PSSGGEELAMTDRQGMSALWGNMRLRIIAVVVVLVTLSAIVSTLQIRVALNQRLDEEISTALERESEEFLLLLAEGRNPDTGQPFADDLEALFDVYFRREVPDERETLIAIVDDGLYGQESAPGVPPAEDLEQDVAFWVSFDRSATGTLQTGGREAWYAVTPITIGGRSAHFVAVNFPRDERREIDQAVLTLGLVQGLTILLSAFLAYLASGRILRPLSSLADTAQTISETDLTRRIPVRGQDEASRIARAFNDMLARLEAAFATQRRFLDEASHEFRAPLTVIRGHVELLDLVDDPVERAATTALITDEIDRMNRMVEDLLTLARAERPDFLDLAEVDIRAWNEDVYRKASVLGEQTWVLEATADVTVRADEQRLTQAVMQLAANAAAHTTAGNTVRVGSAVVDGNLRIWVRDDGPGIAKEDATRIFERFHRGRSDRRTSGLGLSIVNAIAEAHGGRVWVDRAGEPGARFEMSLPLVREVSADES